MADPFSVATGVVSLVVVAIQSTQALYELIEGFKKSPKNIRDMRDDLKSLHEVLLALQGSLGEGDELDVALELPLSLCAQSCQALQEVLRKSSAHTRDSRPSIRDWMMLRFHGTDIEEFKGMLAVHKATITIAVGNLNLRKTVATAEAIEQYQELVTDTTEDIKDQLENINAKLQETRPASGLPASEASVSAYLQLEKASTEQCLAICKGFADKIKDIQPRVQNMVSGSAASSTVLIDAPILRSQTATQLTECMLDELAGKIRDTTCSLSQHQSELDAADRRGEAQDVPRKAYDSLQQCLKVCMQASAEVEKHRTSVFEDVTAASDSRQLVVATLGDLITAKRITAEKGALQAVGQMSDESLRQFLALNQTADGLQATTRTARASAFAGPGRALATSGA